MIHKIRKINDLPELQPSKEWFSVSKARLLSEMVVHQKELSTYRLSPVERARLFSLRLTRRLVPSTAKVVSFGVILSVIFSTSVMAQATVPGQLLWPIKMSFEKAELMFAADPVSEAEILMKHANKRLAELEILSNSNIEQNAKNEAISEVVSRLEHNLVAAESNLKIATNQQTDSSTDGARAKTASAVRSLSKNAELSVRTLQNKAKDIAGVVIVDGRVISGSGKIYSFISVNRQSGIDLPTEEQRGQVAETNKKIVEVLTQAIQTNQDLSTNALNTAIDLNSTTTEKTDAVDLKSVISEKITRQGKTLAESTAVYNALDQGTLKPIILQNNSPELTWENVVGLGSQIEKATATLTEIKDKMTAGDIEAAMTQLKDNDVLISKIVDSLSKIDLLIPSEETEPAAETAPKNEAPEVKVPSTDSAVSQTAVPIKTGS